jgi:hypothetical protein
VKVLLLLLLLYMAVARWLYSMLWPSNTVSLPEWLQHVTCIPGSLLPFRLLVQDPHVIIRFLIIQTILLLPDMPLVAPLLRMIVHTDQRIRSEYACTCHVLILAAAVLAESGDPEPAPASRKGRKKKEEVAAAQAAEEAAREAAEAAAAAAEAAAVAQWLDSGGNPEEDRRCFPYHRWVRAL